MTAIVGYLVNRPSALEGEPGLAYDYILAGNGLFIRAERLGPGGVSLLRATVLVAGAEVSGLAPLAPRLELPQGKVAGDIWQAALRMAGIAYPNELYMAVRWDGGYRLEVPEQETTPASITYTPVPDTVVDIHSHGEKMGAHFSGVDDADDVGFRLCVVVGHLDRIAADAAARVSVYGHTGHVWLGDVFTL
jgi:PRTRC genetic system protein A